VTESNLILASASPTRARLLANAGVPFRVEASDVDEDLWKRRARETGATSEETALALAEAKAMVVSRRFLDCWVIGADQMLDCEDRWFDKPVDRRGAEVALRALRGRTHRMVNGVVLVRAEEIADCHVAVATLTVRAFSEEFLTWYLDQTGDSVLGSVGAYRLEDLGVQLFDAIDGDHSGILGLPLIPLLAMLRRHGIVPD